MRLLLVLLLSCLVVADTAWTGCHDDQDKDQRLRVNCTALGFSGLPEGFEPVTQVTKYVLLLAVLIFKPKNVF